MADLLKIAVPHTDVHRLARRFLEPAQDVLVLSIGLVLFGIMARTLVSLVRQVFRPSLDFRGVIAEILFMLVMVEVVRLLIIYLEQHRIAVDFMVELGIVATLREIILRGVIELGWQQVAALTLFLLALGALLRFGDLRLDESSPSVQTFAEGGKPADTGIVSQLQR
jgi:uncharacterized membrane protein (DUF373 family)